MDDKIFSHGKNTWNSIKHLDNSLKITGQLWHHLESKDEWDGRDWLAILATGLYVGVSGYSTYYNGKQFINALTAVEQPVTTKLSSTPIPARIHFRQSASRSKAMLPVTKTKRNDLPLKTYIRLT